MALGDRPITEAGCPHRAVSEGSLKSLRDYERGRDYGISRRKRCLSYENVVVVAFYETESS